MHAGAADHVISGVESSALFYLKSLPQPGIVHSTRPVVGGVVGSCGIPRPCSVMYEAWVVWFILFKAIQESLPVGGGLALEVMELIRYQIGDGRNSDKGGRGASVGSFQADTAIHGLIITITYRSRLFGAASKKRKLPASMRAVLTSVVSRY